MAGLIVGERCLGDGKILPRHSPRSEVVPAVRLVGVELLNEFLG